MNEEDKVESVNVSDAVVVESKVSSAPPKGKKLIVNQATFDVMTVGEVIARLEDVGFNLSEPWNVSFTPEGHAEITQ